MTKTMDQCSAPDCDAAVAPGLLFCRECWTLIPMEHKLAMVEAYRPLTERHLPLQRAVLVAKHREAVLNAGCAIVRPSTAPAPELHFCAGEFAPDLVAYKLEGLAAFPPPLHERLHKVSMPVKHGVLTLLNVLLPCWAQGLAPTRDQAMTTAARINTGMAPVLDFNPVLRPAEWAEAVAVLIREGIVAERLYGRVTHHELGAP